MATTKKTPGQTAKKIEKGHSARSHPYHIIDPSPWPFVGSLAALLLGIGGALYMPHRDTSQSFASIMKNFASAPATDIAGLAGAFVLISGFLLLFYTMYGWWRDVVHESTTPGVHTKEVRVGLRYGVVLFILSELMFFAAFFGSYFYIGLFPSDAIGGVWPPKGVETLDPFGIPYLNTLILLLSGCTITWAHHELIQGNLKETARKTFYTIVLGLIFVCVQAYEYGHIPFAMDQGVYPSIFFLATGFHGLHVIIGVIFLIVCLFRVKKGHFKANDHLGFEAAAWYWHFVDVVWLFLFVSIYWWGSSPR